MQLPLYPLADVTDSEGLMFMERFGLVESWLDNVGLSHSNNIRTHQEYKLWFGEFCAFIGKTPEQIAKDYESSTMLTERQLMRKYAHRLE